MNAKDFLKQKGILDYNEFVSYQKADSDDYIPIEELLEEYAGIQVKTCNKPAVSNSVLAAIINLCETNIPYYAYGDNQAACEMADRLNEIGRLASTGC